MKSNRLGSYEVSVRLFGVLPVKRMDVKVVKRKKIFPSGEPIGIYVETNGLLVLDTTEVPAKDGLTYAPGENLLKAGDYILEWNQKKGFKKKGFNTPKRRKDKNCHASGAFIRWHIKSEHGYGRIQGNRHAYLCNEDR